MRVAAEDRDVYVGEGDGYIELSVGEKTFHLEVREAALLVIELTASIARVNDTSSTGPVIPQYFEAYDTPKVGA